jgi:hypothetical protein
MTKIQNKYISQHNSVRSTMLHPKMLEDDVGQTCWLRLNGLKGPSTRYDYIVVYDSYRGVFLE